MKMLSPMLNSFSGPFSGSMTSDEMWPRNTLSVVPALLREFDLSFNAFEPTRDVFENDDHFIVSFDMPGVKRDSIKVEVKGQDLMVSSERSRPFREETEKFSKTFILPRTVDSSKIEVHYEDGVLSLRLPKFTEAKPRSLEVQSGARSW